MADVAVLSSDVSNALHQVAGLRKGPVFISDLVGYYFYNHSVGRFRYTKTTDGGATWATGVDVATDAANSDAAAPCIWYDKWTKGDTGTLIHCAFLDPTTTPDSLVYVRLDTNGDVREAKAVIDNAGWVAGGSHADTNYVSITKARSGRLMIVANPVAGTGLAYTSDDGGDTWTSRADPFEAGDIDIIELHPGGEADQDDIWAIYNDRSALEITLKAYDASGDSWSEGAAIHTNTNQQTFYLNHSSTTRWSDNHIILVSHTHYDNASDTLNVYDITDKDDFTAKTSVLENPNSSEAVRVDIMIDQVDDSLYVCWVQGGVWGATVDVFYKKSSDGGDSWDAAVQYSEDAADDHRLVNIGHSIGDYTSIMQIIWFNDDTDDIMTNVNNQLSVDRIGRPFLQPGVQWLDQDTTDQYVQVYMVDRDDRTLAKTGIAASNVTFNLFKNGASAYAPPTGATWTEISRGLYRVTLGPTDLDTPGETLLSVVSFGDNTAETVVTLQVAPAAHTPFSDTGELQQVAYAGADEGVFIELLAADGTPYTGLSVAPTLQLLKNGASTWAAINDGAWVEAGFGVYKVTLDETDKNTLGPMVLRAAPVAGSGLLLETGDFILQETGEKLLQEASSALTREAHAWVAVGVNREEERAEYVRVRTMHTELI